MGNQTNEEYLQSDLYLIDNSQWQKLQINGQQIYRNKFSEDQFKFYKINSINSESIQQILKRSHYSFSNTPKIIIISHQQNQLSYLVQRGQNYLIRYLNDIKDSTYALLLTLRDIFRTLKILVRKYGYFQPHQKLIKITKNKQIIIWIHQQFQICQRQYPLSTSLESQQKMIQKLSWMLDYYQSFIEKKFINFEDLERCINDYLKKEKYNKIQDNKRLYETYKFESQKPLQKLQFTHISSKYDFNYKDHNKNQTISTDSYRSPQDPHYNQHQNGNSRILTNRIKFTYLSPQYPQQKILKPHYSCQFLPNLKMKDNLPIKQKQNYRENNLQLLRLSDSHTRSNSFTNFHTFETFKKTDKIRQTYQKVPKIIEQKMKDSQSQIGLSSQLSRDMNKLFPDEDQIKQDLSLNLLNDLEKQFNEVF